MPQGVRAPNLPTSSIVLELVGIKDLGGGLRQVVRIALVDLLAWIEAAWCEDNRCVPNSSKLRRGQAGARVQEVG